LLKDRVSILSHLILIAIRDDMPISALTEDIRESYGGFSIRSASVYSSRVLRGTAQQFLAKDSGSSSDESFESEQNRSCAVTRDDAPEDELKLETVDEASFSDSNHQEARVLNDVALELPSRVQPAEVRAPRHVSYKSCPYRHRMLLSILSPGLNSCAECFGRFEIGDRLRICTICSRGAHRFHLSCMPSRPFVRRRYTWPDVVRRDASRIFLDCDEDQVSLSLDKAICSSCRVPFNEGDPIWNCPVCDVSAQHDRCSTSSCRRMFLCFDSIS
jgi:hypothetical protein